jgi:hypothetical protein
MSWDTLFAITNMIAIAAWIALAVLPRRPAVLALILYAGVALLCLACAGIVAALVFGGADSGRVAGAAQPDLTDYSVAGIRSLFLSDGGVVLGWTHYLAFDLFVGLWIARDADAKGFGRLVQLPILLLTLMAGPLGLLSWLVVRERRARRSGKVWA